MNERNQAVVLMLLSALSFSLMQAVVKLSATNIGTMEQVFCRNLISMAISFVLLQRSHLPLLGGRKYQPALLARSFFGFIGVVMLFYATAGARQADIAVLNRTSPIWVSLFALLILRERISKVQIPVILLCLAGAVAAMRPSFDSNTLPLVLALLTAVSSGLAYTMIAFCRGQVNPMTVIFHFSLFSTIAAGLLMSPSFVVPTPRDLMMLILIGIFGAGSVLLRQAPDGTGVIAGGAVRAVMEAVGIKNICAKCLRSNNPQNVVKATMQGLQSLRSPEQVAAIRGKSVEEIVG